MNSYEYYMNKGRELEERKLYRRAAEQYNKAIPLSPSPGKNRALSKQEADGQKAAARCLAKAKIKITEGL